MCGLLKKQELKILILFHLEELKVCFGCVCVCVCLLGRVIECKFLVIVLARVSLKL